MDPRQSLWQSCCGALFILWAWLWGIFISWGNGVGSLSSKVDPGPLRHPLLADGPHQCKACGCRGRGCTLCYAVLPMCVQGCSYSFELMWFYNPKKMGPHPVQVHTGCNPPPPCCVSWIVISS